MIAGTAAAARKSGSKILTEPVADPAHEAVRFSAHRAAGPRQFGIDG
jgi:hypothetical protein